MATQEVRITKALVDKAWKYYCKHPTLANSDIYQRLLKAWILKKHSPKAGSR